MKVTFIGSSTCIPDVGHEVSSLLVDGKHLVDAGWCNVLKIREHGFDPLGVESVIFTHFHQDHYIGLPHLLFFMGLQRHLRHDATLLRIIGPSEHLRNIVNAALTFLQIHRFPELRVNLELIPLSSHGHYETGEIRLDTLETSHVSGMKVPEQALVYKFTEILTGRSFVYTGDTFFYPPIAEFAKNVPLLVHDAAHTSAKDAAKIGRLANVKRLYLIHYPEKEGKRLLKEAKKVFPNCFLAREGETLKI